LSVLCASALAFAASAVELWYDDETGRFVNLDISPKLTVLGSHAPDDPILYPERDTATGLLRLRLGLTAQLADWASSELAYEHRARYASDGAGGGITGAMLPSFSEAPYRLTQLDAEFIKGDDKYEHRHEIDRALVALHPKWGDVTIGRQAIGLGRGVLFSAVDVFSPFSPLEVDREWRHGVDAFRVEYRTSTTSSVELLGVFGESWDDSAVLARGRGYLGDVDAELIVGKRAEDAMFAGVVSTIVGNAEVHGELAAFRTPEDFPDGALFGNERWVAKAVAGASYTFDVGNGLYLLGEYHYSGFGVRDAEDLVFRYLDGDFLERFLRGDMQLLGQHGLALQLSYPFTNTVSGSLSVLQSPTDGSGIALPGFRWDFTDYASLNTHLYLPWGPKPDHGIPQSEYGLSGESVFVQLSMYF